MKRKFLVIDLEKCVGCFNCLMACKDEHVGNAWLPYTDEQQKHGEKWINVRRHERGQHPIIDQCFIPSLCNHCHDAPCVRAFPEAAKKRPDGIVLLDPEAAKGNRELVSACPYGHIHWNEDFGCAQKCTMCAHLQDSGWTEPRCVSVCPLRALSIVECEASRFAERVKTEKLKSDRKSHGLVWYKNSYRYKKSFLAGSAAFRFEGGEDVLEGCKVTLTSKAGGRAWRTETDCFGDFKIDRLDAGGYRLELSKEGFGGYERELEIGESLTLPVIYLERA